MSSLSYSHPLIITTTTVICILRCSIKDFAEGLEDWWEEYFTLQYHILGVLVIVINSVLVNASSSLLMMRGILLR